MNADGSPSGKIGCVEVKKKLTATSGENRTRKTSAETKRTDRVCRGARHQMLKRTFGKRRKKEGCRAIEEGRVFFPSRREGNDLTNNSLDKEGN